MADYIPLIIVGGLAVGGFILWKQGVFDNLFAPPAAPAAAAPASGATSTTMTTPSAPCMGTDVLTGQPCPCGSSTTASAMAYAYPVITQRRREETREGGPRRVVIFPSTVGLGVGGLTGLGSTISPTCDCTKCGGAPSVYGGISPSQFSTGGGDLNNFVGSSIAQAGYRI